jgi:hypothetical protein
VFLAIQKRFPAATAASINRRLHRSQKRSQFGQSAPDTIFLEMTFNRIAKFCSVIILVLLVVATLGPASWAPRSPFGWQIDHIVGYFVITSIVFVAWPRPFVVGGALIVAAVLLEALQALTPDRSANLIAACCSAGGVLSATLFAVCVIRARR